MDSVQNNNKSETRTRVVDCDDLFYCLITEPVDLENNKIPITITVSRTKPSNGAINNGSAIESLSCIYYIIPNYKYNNTKTSLQQQQQEPYYLTVLQEYTENNDLKDFGIKMCLLNFQKYSKKHPVYIILSSNLEIYSSFDIMDHLKSYTSKFQLID